MNRRRRFLFGLTVLTVLTIVPIGAAASIGSVQWLALLLIIYSLGVYLIYRMTIRNIKLKYPVVNPEGHADIYSGRMPRPIYEDLRRYPWFFKRKKSREKKEHSKKQD